MKRILLAIVIVVPTVFVGPTAIWGQDIKPIDIKPGLWECKSSSQMSGMTMPNAPQISPEKLAQIPPAQRAQVEAMMKGGGGAPQTTTTKVCVAKENLTKSLFDEKSCTSKLLNSSSSSQQIHVECTRGNTKSSGDLNFDRVDNQHIKGEINLKTTGDSSTSGSAAQNMTIMRTFSYTFLSSDCGDVKPAMDK